MFRLALLMKSERQLGNLIDGSANSDVGRAMIVQMDRINDIIYSGEKKPLVLTIKRPKVTHSSNPTIREQAPGLVVFNLALFAVNWFA